jgi:hypothetical protein
MMCYADRSRMQHSLAKRQSTDEAVCSIQICGFVAILVSHAALGCYCYEYGLTYGAVMALAVLGH